jgi:hypothetical protein
MAGLDSFYTNEVDSAGQGSYSSLSTPGERSSMRHRLVVDPFHSSAHASFDENDGSLVEMAGYNRPSPLKKVGASIVFWIKIFADINFLQ